MAGSQPTSAAWAKVDALLSELGKEKITIPIQPIVDMQ
jgi:hypothetical protein